MPLNLFNELFRYCKADENFLTASFAAVLSHHRPFAEAFVRWSFGDRLTVSAKCDTVPVVDLQVTRKIEGGHLLPDMEVHAHFEGVGPVLVRSEHKLRSPLDPSQLADYKRIEDQEAGLRAVVFVSAIDGDVRAAERLCDRAAHWRDMVSLGEPFGTDPIVAQWLQFMIAHDLGPSSHPLTVEEKKVFAEKVSHLMDRLDGVWGSMPAPLSLGRRVEVQPRYDRAGLYFGLPRKTKFAPRNDPELYCVIAGFRFGPNNMKVPMLDSASGIDLALAIHTPPSEYIDIGIVASGAARLRQASMAHDWRLHVLHGSQCLEPWFKLLALAPLSSLGAGQSDPVAVAVAAAERLRAMIRVLFEDDPVLAEHLQRIWPNRRND